jgi:hypothetical protein
LIENAVPPPEFAAVIHFETVLQHRFARGNAESPDRFRSTASRIHTRTAMATPV